MAQRRRTSPAGTRAKKVRRTSDGLFDPLPDDKSKKEEFIVAPRRRANVGGTTFGQHQRLLLPAIVGERLKALRLVISPDDWRERYGYDVSDFWARRDRIIRKNEAER